MLARSLLYLFSDSYRWNSVFKLGLFQTKPLVLRNNHTDCNFLLKNSAIWFCVFLLLYCSVFHAIIVTIFYLYFTFLSKFNARDFAVHKCVLMSHCSRK
jgi:hypothetical protein